MNWEYFYNRYDNWSDETICTRISALEDVGPVDEIDEVASNIDEKNADALVRKSMSFGTCYSFKDILEFDGLVSEDVFTVMTEAAIRRRDDLNPDLIAEYDGLVEEGTLSHMVMLALLQKKPFTTEQIVNLDGLVPQDLLDRAALTAMPDLKEKDLTALEDIISEDALEKLEDRLWPDKKQDSDSSVSNNNSLQRRHKHGLLGTLALAGMFSESGRKKTSVPFRIGDHVCVKYRGQEGTVVDINGNLIMVALADGRTDSYSASQLERAW